MQSFLFHGWWSPTLCALGFWWYCNLPIPFPRQANLSDALVAKAQQQQHAEADVPDKLMKPLTEAALAAANDNDKIKCNAVRALGNFTRLFSPQLVQTAGVTSTHIQEKKMKKKRNRKKETRNRADS